MPKDDPIRSPRLSPAGLPPEELARHPERSERKPDGLRTPSRPAPARCRFVSSHGGVTHCGDAQYLAGFCRFHYDCLARGELSPLGRILDVVKDQARRREINLHGISLPRLDRVTDDPLLGSIE